MQYDFGNLESPLSGAVFINGNLEPWRDALHSSHKGDTRPSYAVEGMLWVDDTTNPWLLKMFDGANDITIGSFDTTTNTFTPSGVSQSAEDISFDNADSGLAATNVQDAIDEAVNDFSDFEGRAEGFATAAQGALADTAVQPLEMTNAINTAKGVAKAWVNFNGTGVVAINDSYNVSSITDNGTGSYTINLEVAMSDEDYNVMYQSSLSIGSRTGGIRCDLAGRTTTTASLLTSNSSAAAQDHEYVVAEIYGDLA